MSLPFRVAVVVSLIGLGAIFWSASYSRPPQPCAMGEKADKCE